MSILLTVIAGISSDYANVKATGIESHVIRNEERKLFKIDNSEKLKDILEDYTGQRPDDVNLSSSDFPWGYLYHDYNWNEIETEVGVMKIKIQDIVTQPVIVTKKIFKNKSKKQATYNASITDTVTNTVESSWTKLNKIAYGYIIKGSFKISDMGGEANQSFTFDHSWGQGGITRHMTTLGSSTGVVVTLDPQESVTAELIATRGTMKIKVKYDLKLKGSAVINYESTHNGHHFWSMPIEKIFQKAQIPNYRTVTEEILINYYSDAKVIIRDLNGKEKAVTYLSYDNS